MLKTLPLQGHNAAVAWIQASAEQISALTPLHMDLFSYHEYICGQCAAERKDHIQVLALVLQQRSDMALETQCAAAGQAMLRHLYPAAINSVSFNASEYFAEDRNLMAASQQFL